MPTRRASRASEGIDEILTRACVGGIVYQHDRDGRPLAQPTMPEIEAFWIKHRDALLPEYIERNPGERPYAWWAFDRPRLGLPESRWCAWELQVVHRIGGVAVRPRRPSGDYQREYLETNNLIGDAERAALAAKDEYWRTRAWRKENTSATSAG